MSFILTHCMTLHYFPKIFLPFYFYNLHSLFSIHLKRAIHQLPFLLTHFFKCYLDLKRIAGFQANTYNNIHSHLQCTKNSISFSKTIYVTITLRISFTKIECPLLILLFLPI